MWFTHQSRHGTWEVICLHGWGSRREVGHPPNWQWEGGHPPTWLEGGIGWVPWFIAFPHSSPLPLWTKSHTRTMYAVGLKKQEAFVLTWKQLWASYWTFLKTATCATTLFKYMKQCCSACIFFKFFMLLRIGMRRKKLTNCYTSTVVTESRKASSLSLQKCQMMYEYIYFSVEGAWWLVTQKIMYFLQISSTAFSMRRLGRVYWKISDISFRA